MYMRSWAGYPQVGGTAGLNMPMTGVGGVTGTMPTMPTMPPMPMPMPGVGFPGTVPGTMPLVGGVTGTMPTVPFAVPPSVPSGAPMTPGGTVIPGVTGAEESYVENILRMNLGKVATIYMTFENNCEWNAKVFKGVLEAAGRDHIIISDPTTGKRYLLLTVNLDYITFDQPLTYTLPFGSAATMGTMGLTREE